MATIEKRLSGRADYSTFLVHLVRRHKGTATEDILRRILKDKCLKAQGAHCFFKHNFDVDDADHFNVVCLTEAPLHQIKSFLGKIEGRTINMTSYGLVFTTDLISQHGGNPVLYINTRHQTLLRNAAKAVFTQAKNQGFELSDLTPLLPFINIFGKTSGGSRYDFYWEREWRVVGDLRFQHKNVVVGLCPADKVDEFEDDFQRIRFISPRWSLDQIITHLRRPKKSLRNGGLK